MFSCDHLSLLLSGGFLALALLVWIHRRARAAQTALRETEERNRLLLSHTNATIYTMTPDGVFTYVSPNWPRFLGHPADGVVGKNFRFVMIPEDVPAFTAFLNEVVHSGKPRSGIEYRVRHTSGTVHWHTSSITPVYDEKKRSMIYVGVAHDIHELKQTQEELRLANDDLTRLIASREEELRTAVGAALDIADITDGRIGRKIHNSLCQELVGLLRMAESADATRNEDAGRTRQYPGLQEQVAKALFLARDISHELTSHDLETQTLPETLAVFARQFDRAPDIIIELNCDPSLPEFPKAVAGHIYRVVREAVINALDHGKAQHIWIDLVQEPRQIVVSITNDGTAIPLDPARLTQGVGLRRTHLRTRLLGGSFSLRHDEQNNTIAELIIPGETRKDAVV
jgi:PAS domain S-box-containing protein